MSKPPSLITNFEETSIPPATCPIESTNRNPLLSPVVPKTPLTAVQQTPSESPTTPTRTSWTSEADYQFVKTLAHHTRLSQTGLELRHYYVDTTIIQNIHLELFHDTDLSELSQRFLGQYPNKNELHHSPESFQLLLELQRRCPRFTFQQLNHKHINMWTRTIVPFRQVYETGSLFRGKPLFHKDCKRFVKVFINYFQRGTPEMYRRTSKTNSSKLLEQWVEAMFEVHKGGMSWFMTECGIRLARAYLLTKPNRSRNEQEVLERPNVESVLQVLKGYYGHICEYEDNPSRNMYGRPIVSASCFSPPPQKNHPIRYQPYDTNHMLPSLNSMPKKLTVRVSSHSINHILN